MKKDLFREFDTSFNRSVKDRLRYGFIKTYKPVIDDYPYLAFDTLKEYRIWCKKNVPKWLGLF